MNGARRRRLGAQWYKVMVLIFTMLAPPALRAQNGDFADFGEDAKGLVVTEAPERPAVQKSIGKDQIERIAAPDLPALLEEALDITITRRGAYGNTSDINMRGFNTERIAILIDGVPVNSAAGGGFDFNTLDMNNIERIEVIYGGADSKYNVSGALGGVINIITTKEKPRGLQFGFGIMNTAYLPGAYTDWAEDGARQEAHAEDLADTQKVEASFSYGARRFSAGIHLFGNRAGNHYLYVDSFLHKIRRKQYNEVWDAGGGALFALNFDNAAKLVFNADAYYAERELPDTGFSYVTGTQNDFTLRENLMFEAPVFLREDVSVEASLSHSFTHMDYTRENSAGSQAGQQTVSLVNRWAYFVLRSLTLRAGWDYRYIHLDSTGTGARGRHDGGAYLTAEWMPVCSVRIIPSVKAVTDGQQVVPVPKLGFIWNAADFITLKNNYFRSFKFPDFDDLFWVGNEVQGNPDLRPEDGWGADVGAEFHLAPLTLESSAFGQYTTDSIHWHKAAGGNWEPQNIGTAALFGADLRAGADIPLRRGPFTKLRPQLSYQYLLSYLLSYGYSWQDARRVPYQPEHTAGASAELSWKSGSFTVSAHYESARFYSTTNLVELEPYVLLNASVNQSIGKHVRINLALRNLLNKSYESYNRYPMPGFNVTLGLRVEGGAR